MSLETARGCPHRRAIAFVTPRGAVDLIHQSTDFTPSCPGGRRRADQIHSPERRYSGPNGGAGEYAKPKRLSGWQGPEVFIQQSKPPFLQQGAKARDINQGKAPDQRLH
jgi:hypothetical protein